MTTATPALEPSDDARRLECAFRCAALDPALAGVLLFDLEPRLIEPVSRVFAAVLGGPAGPPAARIPLGAATRDEELWCRSRLERRPDGIAFTVGPSPLVDGAAPPPLAVVADLASLSVAGMRAAVQLIGADLVSVEQPGLRIADRPRTRWLALCRSEDAGRVTPHLLDRFAVRLAVPGLRTVPDAGPTDAPLPHDTFATTTDRAVTRVHEILGPGAGPRRSLALARIARALATLGGHREVTAQHCEEAARLIGLRVTEPTPADDRADSEAPGPRLPPLPRPGDIGRRGGRPAKRRRSEEKLPLLASGPAEGVGPAPGATLGMPYPEDEAMALREFMPLRNPWQRRSGPTSTRGAVVGTRRARDLRDLALVRTVREAAVHQRIRGNREFTVAPVDLHSNLRAPAPERLLTLLLDHTCRGDWDWQDALTPFLQWAYTSRAAIHVVEVGGADAADELRAESFAARGVLDPRVLAALYRPKGRATPLAHGIEQAGQVLRQAFRRQGSALAEAWLVVVTDGRGNVPLRASHTGRLHGPVAVQGIEDSLTAAASFAAMDRGRLNVAVVDTARRPYGDLPFALADTLGATVVEGRDSHGG
ncbi:magnesium chelatase [Streptomyces albiflavescens]|uniref:Magnesium chelatase n=1 Tax=Streptomyces albiflavescens TaxID=1623582 RepID=A0A917Y8F9_9ACTN|nr:magnesium chelatase [Streptomyces albiflavescens]GGN78037.1 magnesium chelatase [Streptomyces albiflavescens]